MTLAYAAEKVTDATAIAAVSSPVWLPYVQEVSQLAALLLPIAGLLWLIIQMVGYFRRK